ncbi:MAG: hypothetical protein HKM93_11530 [Desulfobacteraceae bacterium]|nr:hypothetical protein [Desulfobacteraceae bacterium]
MSRLKRKAEISSYINALLQKSRLPRNQLSAISGLTNTYIIDLEQGNFSNVRREKLIALAVALSLSLRETDELLDFFDRMHLSIDDIAIFLSVSDRIRTSSVMMPLIGDVALGLAQLSAEKDPGDHIVVSPEPSYCIYSTGYRRVAARSDLEDHPLYGELGEALNQARHEQLYHRLKHYRFDQYICVHCLEMYLHRFLNDDEKAFRRQHVVEITNLLKAHANFNLHLLAKCPNTAYTFRLSPPDSDKSDTLFLVLWPHHRVSYDRVGRLSGFTTSNQSLIESFKDELVAVKQAVIQRYTDRDRLIDYLSNLTI